MPLLRSTLNQLLEFVGHLLSDALYVFAKFSMTFAIHRCANNAMMSNSTIGEISRGGQECCTSSQSKSCWTGRQSCSLTKEFNLDTPASDIAITQQTQNLVVAQRLQHCRSRFWTERNDRHAKLSTKVGKPFKEFGRLDGFNNNSHLVTKVSSPSSGPFPATKMRQGKYDSFSAFESRNHVFVVALHCHRRSNLSAGQCW